MDHSHHEHTFGQDQVRPGERRTVIVIAMTTVMMVVEISAGTVLGSMALLADGLHMASHAAALAIAVVAYVYARRNARNRQFCFGTGKVNALGGFAGAVLLAVFALMMAWESVSRFFNPITIVFNQAIMVAVIGLVVNGISAIILGGDHSHNHEHGHDHNLRSAYLHVLADALTSVLAVAALLAGKFYGLEWLDPAMGIVGSLLVARWSIGLIRDTSRVLLDRQAPDRSLNRIRDAIESRFTDANITDLHVWAIAPAQFAAVISVSTNNPTPPQEFKSVLPGDLGLVHVTVEVNQPPTKSE